jgi:hypothetical protein
MKYSIKKYRRHKSVKSKHNTKKKYNLKGGFNRSQFQGAVAMCAYLGYTQIILINKKNTEEKHTITFNTNGNMPTIKSSGGYDRMQIPGTFSNINIKNWDIYVGNKHDNNEDNEDNDDEDNDLLIKIEGNVSVTDRFANVFKALSNPNTANALVITAENKLEEHNNVRESELELVKNVKNELTKNKILGGPENKFESLDIAKFLAFIGLMYSLCNIFFLLLMLIIAGSVGIAYSNRSNKSRTQSTPKSEERSTPKSEQQQFQDVVAVVNTDNVPPAENVIDEFEYVLGEVDKFPQYKYINGVPEVIKNKEYYYCVNPYVKSNTNKKDRIKSCNKTGPPHKNFSDKKYNNLQTCYSLCYL